MSNENPGVCPVAAAEQAIVSILTKLEAQTGLRVDGVYLDRMFVGTLDVPYESAVCSIKVTLGRNSETQWEPPA